MQHGRFYLSLERGFEWLIGRLHARPRLRAAAPARHAGDFHLHRGAAVVLYVVMPKGFFPQQDTGIIAGLTDAPQDISFSEMVRLAAAPDRRHRRAIPDVAGWAASSAAARPLNNGFRDPGAQAARRSAMRAPIEIITRLRAKIAQVPGGTVFLQAART